VADAHNQLSLLAHAVDKLHRNHSSIVRFTELFSSSVQCAAKPVTLHTNSDSSTSPENMPFVTRVKSVRNQQWFGLVYWCLTALSAQIGYIVPQEYDIYHEGPGDKTNT